MSDKLDELLRNMGMSQENIDRLAPEITEEVVWDPDKFMFVVKPAVKDERVK